MGLRCIALDADAPALAELTYLLTNNPRVEKVVSHTDINEAVKTFETQDFDAVFVCLIHHAIQDINHTFKTQDGGPLFVGLARTSNQAIDAYAVGAIDYILKPATAMNVDSALGRVERLSTSRNAAKNQRIACDRNGVTHLVDVREVIHVRSNGDYTIVTATTGEYLCRISLTMLEQDFSAHGLLRVHRQWLVARDRIESLRADCATVNALVGTTEVPISRRLYKTVKDLLA